MMRIFLLSFFLLGGGGGGGLHSITEWGNMRLHTKTTHDSTVNVKGVRG